MATYYEILGLPTTASVSEVEIAVEAEYNQYLRQVTHHDPEVVDEANRKLRKLEQIRTTLTDPTKRADYDQSLNVGGLADPEAILQTAQPAPAMAPKSPHQRTGKLEKRTDAWVCGKCQLANAVGLQFCSDCGNEIGRACPKCQKVIAIFATFCAYCGAEIETVMHEQAEARVRKALEESARRVKELQEQIQVEEAAIQKPDHLRAKKLANPFWGEAKQMYSNSTSCLSRTGAFLAMMAVLIAYMFVLTTFPQTLGDIALSEGEAVTFVLIGFLVLGTPIILLMSLVTAYSIKPELNRRIQMHMDRIAELEQAVRRTKEASLSAGQTEM